MIIYIHGFGSSGISSKAFILKDKLDKKFGDVISPSLSYIPKLAIDTLEQIILSYKKYENIYLIGTSLGGYYATYLADKFDIQAILINPAVNPTITLKQYLSNSINYYDKSKFELTQNHIDQLKSYEIKDIQNELYMLLVQKGDELLDYKESLQKFKNSKQIIKNNGTHRFEGIEKYIPSIINFINREN